MAAGEPRGDRAPNGTASAGHHRDPTIAVGLG